MVVDPGGTPDPVPPDDEGDPDTLLVRNRLPGAAMLAPEVPVVGGVHDDRVAEAAGVSQRLDGRPDQVVYGTERFQRSLPVGVDRAHVLRGEARRALDVRRLVP